MYSLMFCLVVQWNIYINSTYPNSIVENSLLHLNKFSVLIHKHKKRYGCKVYIKMFQSVKKKKNEHEIVYVNQSHPYTNKTYVGRYDHEKYITF